MARGGDLVKWHIGPTNLDWARNGTPTSNFLAKVSETDQTPRSNASVGTPSDNSCQPLTAVCLKLPAQFPIRQDANDGNITASIMMPTTRLLTIRPKASFIPAMSRCAARNRSFATQHGLGANDTPGHKRRGVTPFNDDGYVPWTELSAGEKTARATQQTFNFGFVLLGVALTGTVGYFLWTDVFAPDSKINQFNRAVDKIKRDPRCIEVLGDSKKIIAHGEETANKWRRARPVASTERTDQQGNEHLVMHFHVDGPSQNGIAQLHMVKRRGQSDYEYKYLFVDVKGHERIYLENADSSGKSVKRQLSFFGVKW
ncbi:mitochondrial import inner membrane translocase subunit tim21 [Conoideocrella luteorostrata]|uniref:Mitochondrial import inner membrane translocase subunit Tim21 n=1 Tax=Conoideocrella luteorostrata TaxID=1105319 RepID=A0AAJ0CJL1_9HYPO|nr:mitochondrial import inner membrane translocase subunit tim21 [Conoideocrella luteorostrata]